AGHLSRPPPPVTDLCPWLPPAVDSVIARALSKSPDARYYNCGELAAAAGIALLADSPRGRDSDPGASAWSGDTVTPRSGSDSLSTGSFCPGCGAEVSV